MELADLRTSIPALERLSWLATPSSAPGATPVIRAIAEELRQWSDGLVSWADRDRPAQRSRQLMAELLGVRAADIALVQSTAAAAATVGWSLPDGARIVVGTQEFRSNVFPWLAAERRGATVVQVPMPDGQLTSSALVDAIDDRTHLVAVSSVQSASGSRVDLVPVAERCRQVGARLFVDATQSAGVLRLPEGVDADFVAAHGYKWLLGVRGAGWLYVRPDRLPELDPLAPSSATAADFDRIYGGPLQFAPDARRLDLPTGWPSWAGAAAGLELISALDPVQVEDHALALAGRLRDGATAIGLRCLPTEVPSQIIAVAHPEAEQCLVELEAADVIATARAGAVRFGFHAFNTAEDVDRALAVLGAQAS